MVKPLQTNRRNNLHPPISCILFYYFDEFFFVYLKAFRFLSCLIKVAIPAYANEIMAFSLTKSNKKR
jgi:hypothetical protein